MKRLFLLRHAKAVAACAKVEDRDRALSARGRAGALKMGRYLGANFAAPGLVWCSPARRTVETWDRIAANFPAAPKADCVPALYLASACMIAALVAAADDRATGLMIVGHNPGLESLAAALGQVPAQAEEEKRWRQLREKFPTGAVAILAFDTSHWREIAPHSGRLAAFVRPRDL
jgi:phosphohistidine phosphatase